MIKALFGDRARALRLGNHALWSVLDQVANLGIQRLVFFPLVARAVTEHQFGTFIVAVSLVQLVGVAPSSGFVTYLFRENAAQGAQGRQVMLRTSVVMSLLVTGACGLLFVAAAPLVARAWHNAELLPLIALLAPYLVLTNATETLLCTQRIERNFRFVAAIHGVQSLLLLAALPLYPLLGLAALPVAYVFASAATCGIQVFLRREEVLARPLFEPGLARSMVAVWWPLSLATLVWMSAGYLDRVLLGFWWPEREVAVFFAAVSTAAVFGVPGTLTSGLVLSLLGKVRSRESFPRAFYLAYAAGTLLFAALLGAIGVAVGPFVVDLLYPTLSADARSLWTLAVVAIALSNVTSLSRPFVIKFLPVKWIPVLAWTGLAGRVAPLLLLVPAGGRDGAVLALVIGSAVAAAAWFGLYVYKFVLVREGADALLPPEPGVSAAGGAP